MFCYIVDDAESNRGLAGIVLPFEVVTRILYSRSPVHLDSVDQVLSRMVSVSLPVDLC